MNVIVNLETTATPYHQHNEYEIIICMKGSGNFCGMADAPVSQGSIIVVPPRVMHKCVFLDTLDRIYIRGEFSHYFTFESPRIMRDNAWKEGSMLAEMIYRNRYASQEYVAVLVDAFVHCLMQSLQTKDKIHTAVTHIINQITTGFYDPALNLQTLLEASGYAEDYIRAQFKKITGKPPNTFLTKVRISHACYLMETYGKTVSLMEIAEKCGYTDYVYFSRKFKAIIGVAPRTYMEETFGHNI